MDNVIGAEVWIVYFDPADLDDLNAVFSSRAKALDYVDDECDRLEDIWLNPEITYENEDAVIIEFDLYNKVLNKTQRACAIIERHIVE